MTSKTQEKCSRVQKADLSQRSIEFSQIAQAYDLDQEVEVLAAASGKWHGPGFSLELSLDDARLEAIGVYPDEDPLGLMPSPREPVADGREYEIAYTGKVMGYSIFGSITITEIGSAEPFIVHETALMTISSNLDKISVNLHKHKADKGKFHDLVLPRD